MPYNIDGSDYTKSWSIICGQQATVEHPLLAKCLALASALHAKVPLVTIEILSITPPPMNQYSFILKAVDGRRWSQIVEMYAVADPKMNWRHNSFWRRSEFVLIDDFRVGITELIQSIKPTSITVTFLA